MELLIRIYVITDIINLTTIILKTNKLLINKMNETLETILWIGGGLGVLAGSVLFIGYSCEKIGEGISLYKHDNHFYKSGISDKKPNLIKSVFKSYFCKID
ncbi:hypothetical protein GOV12_08185 [Candidatus Pacearchaeota archaeon]|nr:hypothetical protein [Candidatus Pacearchaeota archaeon]